MAPSSVIQVSGSAEIIIYAFFKKGELFTAAAKLTWLARPPRLDETPQNKTVS